MRMINGESNFFSFLSQQNENHFIRIKQKMLSCKTIILPFIVELLLQNKNDELKQSRKTMTMTSFLKRKNVFKLFNEDIVCPFFLSISNVYVYNIIYFEKTNIELCKGDLKCILLKLN
jgi:hypothetical protein